MSDDKITPEYLNSRQAAAYIGTSVPTLERWRKQRGGASLREGQ